MVPSCGQEAAPHRERNEPVFNIGPDRAKRRGAVAVMASAVALACAGPGTEPPERSLEAPGVQEAAARAMASLDRRLVCWRGETPRFDGRIDEDEYADASSFRWNAEWIEAMQQEISSRQDLDFEGWIKHDGEHVYLALDVIDDLFYGIDTERWLPPQAPDAHVIGERERGWPWFGDMVEVLLYSRMLDVGEPISDVTGDGRGIQIIYNLTKSHEGGVGVPGMLPHGPGRTVENWENNARWILDDVIETRTVMHERENRYHVEFRIRLDGGIEITDGGYWAAGDADTPIGFNLVVGDVDLPENSPDGLLHHETWWAGKTTPRGQAARAKLWGVLVLTSQRKPVQASGSGGLY